MNKEEKKEYSKKYYQKHKKEAQLYHKEYYKKHKEKLKKHYLNSYYENKKVKTKKDRLKHKLETTESNAIKENILLKEKLTVIKNYYLKHEKQIHSNFNKEWNLTQNKLFLETVFCGKKKYVVIIKERGSFKTTHQESIYESESSVVAIPCQQMTKKEFEKIYKEESVDFIPFFDLWIGIQNAKNRYIISKQVQVILV